LGKRGGDTRMKRQLSPRFWNIRRKESQFVVSAKPGPHPKQRSYPLGMILRDVLGVASTMREAERILVAGKVKVDGQTRRSARFPVGLMDTVALSTGQTYRVVPKESTLLTAISIDESEKNVKLAKVTSKSTIRGKKTQYGFHDGKTLISEQALRVGDSCLLELPEAKIKDHVRFDKGCTVFIVKGENAGKVGMVEDIRDGIFSLPKRALVTIGDRAVELPVEMVMAVGADRPVIKVN
jgi:small subunit ribosomal protein S4e